MDQLLRVKHVPSRGAMSIVEFAEWSGLSKSKVYMMINAKELVARKVGRRSIITFPDALKWLDNLPVSEGVIDKGE